MPNNQFKKGELYSFITGIASTAIARRLQKNLMPPGSISPLNNGVYSIIYGKKKASASRNCAMLHIETNPVLPAWLII
jgi:hypothetical protein